MGAADYKINNVKTNGGFIDFIELYSKKDKKIIKYDFYDTQDALKNAYVLGEVSEIRDINNLDYNQKINLANFKNSTYSKNINSNKNIE